MQGSWPQSDTEAAAAAAPSYPPVTGPASGTGGHAAGTNRSFPLLLGSPTQPPVGAPGQPRHGVDTAPASSPPQAKPRAGSGPLQALTSGSHTDSLSLSTAWTPGRLDAYEGATSCVAPNEIISYA